MELKITELAESEASEFCSVVIEVYDEFVAPDYSEEGNRHFYSFMTEDAVKQRLAGGALTLIARADGRAAGVCAFRDGTHLSTFFVRKQYQGRGIGRMMFAYSLRKLKAEYPEAERITVFSSPFAVPVYKRLGFIQTGESEEKNGIISYPMDYKI